jgi:hypothetical protein
MIDILIYVPYKDCVRIVVLPRTWLEVGSSPKPMSSKPSQVKSFDY